MTVKFKLHVVARDCSRGSAALQVTFVTEMYLPIGWRRSVHQLGIVNVKARRLPAVPLQLEECKRERYSVLPAETLAGDTDTLKLLAAENVRPDDRPATPNRRRPTRLDDIRPGVCDGPLEICSRPFPV